MVFNVTPSIIQAVADSRQGVILQLGG